jgi:hypothetical protein
MTIPDQRWSGIVSIAVRGEWMTTTTRRGLAMNTKWMKWVFGVSAAYDGILGVVFLFVGPMVYDYFGIERPNHLGYLHFPALLLIVFALLYWQIATNPVKHRDLIPYGIGLKAAYCGVVFFHRATAGIPTMWMPFAWLDLGFLILFLLAWRTIGKAGQPIVKP